MRRSPYGEETFPCHPGQHPRNQSQMKKEKPSLFEFFKVSTRAVDTCIQWWVCHKGNPVWRWRLVCQIGRSYTHVFDWQVLQNAKHPKEDTETLSSIQMPCQYFMLFRIPQKKKVTEPTTMLSELTSEHLLQHCPLQDDHWQLSVSDNTPWWRSSTWQSRDAGKDGICQGDRHSHLVVNVEEEDIRYLTYVMQYISVFCVNLYNNATIFLCTRQYCTIMFVLV